MAHCFIIRVSQTWVNYITFSTVYGLKKQMKVLPRIYYCLQGKGARKQWCRIGEKKVLMNKHSDLRSNHSSGLSINLFIYYITSITFEFTTYYHSFHYWYVKQICMSSLAISDFTLTVQLPCTPLQRQPQFWLRRAPPLPQFLQMHTLSALG